MRKMMIIDTETGGLNPEYDQLIEVAYVDADDPECRIATLVMPHEADLVSPEAAAVNGYHVRDLADPDCWATDAEIKQMYADLEGVTLVGANVAFDAAFLRHYARENLLPNPAPWHYRMLDIESMAYGLGAFDDVPGMKAIYDQFAAVRESLHMDPLPAPDHTAAGDVLATFHVFQQLRALRVPDTAVA